MARETINITGCQINTQGGNMKVLIVDDSNEKALSILDGILSRGVLKKDDITIVSSINDAVLSISKEKYELLVVDMCIPDAYPGHLIQDGGLLLIKEIRRDKKRLIAPTEIIVLTAFDHLAEQYKEDIKKESFEIITFDNSSEEWKDKINDKIEYLDVYSSSPEEQRKYQYDIAILTAIPNEKEAIEELNPWQRLQIIGDSTVYNECIWDCNGRNLKVVTTSLMQMGMVSAAVASTKLIYNFTPHFLLMPGISGGIKDDYEFGDIIIPREVKDYCSGKYTTPNTKKDIKEAISNPIKYFMPTAMSIPTDVDIINIFNKSFKEILSEIHAGWKENTEYKVPSIRNGYMASGDSVVQNGAVIDMMIKNHLRNADGLDMEAYGVYYAAQQAIYPKPIPICMKSISDFANKEKNDKHQKYAAYVSANFLKYFVLNELCDYFLK
jgi:nucleoside phosphorylase